MYFEQDTIFTSRFECSRDEYLRFERSVEYRNEYIDGWMIRMPPVNNNHHAVSNEVAFTFHAQLRHRAPLVFIKSMRTKVEKTGSYFYPDVVIVASDNASTEDKHADSLLNPTVIVEVMTTETENYDRGMKAEQYRQIPTLEEILFIAADTCHVTHYQRLDGDTWTLKFIDDAEALIEFPAVDCRFKLASIYEKASFNEQ